MAGGLIYEIGSVVSFVACEPHKVTLALDDGQAVLGNPHDVVVVGYGTIVFGRDMTVIKTQCVPMVLGESGFVVPLPVLMEDGGWGRVVGGV